MGQDPTPKVGLELPLHEPREPWSIFLPGRAGEECLEVGEQSGRQGAEATAFAREFIGEARARVGDPRP